MAEENITAILIKQIHSEMEKNANNSLRQDDLTMSQITVLIALDGAEDGQMELKELEHLLHVAQSTAAGIVKRLEQKKFVTGFTDSTDRRRKLVRITPEGHACCRRARANMDAAEANLTSALTESERETLISLLKKVRGSFR